MSGTYLLLRRAINHKLSYRGLIPPAPPINLTLSVTNRCDSRCRTCGIWKQKKGDTNELSLDEIEKTLKTIGPVYFFNISGGEPFLRNDLHEIVSLGIRHLSPKIIHIPTNGINPEKIESTLRAILLMTRNLKNEIPIAVKPSFDGVGIDHDSIRGVSGNYDRLLDTIERLKLLKTEFPNLSLGLGTVVSRLNIDNLPQITKKVNELKVDSYINEIAEERAEMSGQEIDITPDPDQYEKAMLHFKEEIRGQLARSRGLVKISQAFRLLYYDLAPKILREKRQIIPCYAGISNAHISADGEIWPCCTLGDEFSLGQLRQNDYDFMKIWHSDQARKIRMHIKNKKCFCPLANQSYANLLYHPSSAFKALLALITK